MQCSFCINICINIAQCINLTDVNALSVVNALSDVNADVVDARIGRAYGAAGAFGAAEPLGDTHLKYPYISTLHLNFKMHISTLTLSPPSGRMDRTDTPYFRIDLFYD